MTEKLPHGAQTLADRNADVWRAFSTLGTAVAEAGPLDERTRRLIKIALAMAAGSEGGTHSHVRRAIEEGLTAEEMRHIALLAIPTLGLPAAIKGMTWIDDIIEGKRSRADQDGADSET